MNTTTDNRIVGRQTETCRGGNWLCAEAERLWAAVNAAYALAVLTRTPESWDNYDSAHASYNAHAAHPFVPGG